MYGKKYIGGKKIELKKGWAQIDAGLDYFEAKAGEYYLTIYVDELPDGLLEDDHCGWVIEGKTAQEIEDKYAQLVAFLEGAVAGFLSGVE